jgi:hypothetical protein
MPDDDSSLRASVTIALGSSIRLANCVKRQPCYTSPWPFCLYVRAIRSPPAPRVSTPDR